MRVDRRGLYSTALLSNYCRCVGIKSPTEGGEPVRTAPVLPRKSETEIAMRRSPVAHEEEERALRSLSRRANQIINVGTALTVSAAGLSTIYFLGLQYLTNNKIDLLPDSNILWKVAVVAYFSSWVLGVRFDKDNEEDAYVMEGTCANILCHTD